MTQNGLVTATHGRHAVVESEDAARRLCHFRGKKNEVVVGDHVLWSNTEDAGIIEKVQERKNLFYRSDELRTKSFAANIDQIVVLVASDPDFSEEQIVRALISANSQNIPAFIALNKADLTAPFERALNKLKHYPPMGYEVLALTLMGTDSVNPEFTERLKNKISFIMGPSGAGKSTLINRLVPNAQAQTGEISKALQSGKHTTTATTLYWTDALRTSALIDSPGFQEFGLNHIEPSALAELMPDLKEFSTGCKFYNCTHLHEPGCVVRAQVDNGRISASRYKIYGQLFTQLSASRY
jgi:ribosome biogenesis GTPase